MKAFGVLIFVVLAVVAAQGEEACYKDVDQACNQQSAKLDKITGLPQCNAKYGGHIDHMMNHMVTFANSNLVRSFEYLLMSTHYSNYEKNRPGFEKLFRGLSDEKWDSTIDLIKHITKRGGAMKFAAPTLTSVANGTSELDEIQSVAKALDIEKELAAGAFNIHKEASLKSDLKHDPEISSYIEKEFVHDHSSNIRKLAGYVSDLRSLLSGPDGALSLFLFDEFLKKE